MLINFVKQLPLLPCMKCNILVTGNKLWESNLHTGSTIQRNPIHPDRLVPTTQGHSLVVLLADVQIFFNNFK